MRLAILRFVLNLTMIIDIENLKLKYLNQPEDELMLKAITDVNLSHNIPLFNGIIFDLFPGVKTPKADFGLLEKAIYNNLESMHLQVNFVKRMSISLQI